MYQNIKLELSRRSESTRYFSRAWFETFRACETKSNENRKNGIDAWYRSGNLLLNHAFDAIYNSDFYKSNSPAYCEFLSIYNEMKH